MKNLVLLYLLFHLCLCTMAQSPVDSYVHKGNEYYRQEQYGLAENQYRQALQQAPDNSKAQYNLANALYRQKKYDDAESILNKVATTNNNAVKSAAYYNAGVIYSKEKDLQASIEAYKNALRYNPNDNQARENLQKALLELRKQQSQKQKPQPSNMNQKQAEQKLKEL